MTTALLKLSVLAQKMADVTDFSTSTAGHQHLSTGPSGPLDIIIGALALLIVILVLVLTIWYFVKPKEKSPNHIKRRILRSDF